VSQTTSDHLTRSRFSGESSPSPQSEVAMKGGFVRRSRTVAGLGLVGAMRCDGDTLNLLLSGLGCSEGVEIGLRGEREV
jgi:hypothetical protein